MPVKLGITTVGIPEDNAFNVGNKYFFYFRWHIYVGGYNISYIPNRIAANFSQLWPKTKTNIEKNSFQLVGHEVMMSIE